MTFLHNRLFAKEPAVNAGILLICPPSRRGGEPLQDLGDRTCSAEAVEVSYQRPVFSKTHSGTWGLCRFTETSFCMSYYKKLSVFIHILSQKSEVYG